MKKLTTLCALVLAAAGFAGVAGAAVKISVYNGGLPLQQSAYAITSGFVTAPQAGMPVASIIGSASEAEQDILAGDQWVSPLSPFQKLTYSDTSENGCTLSVLQSTDLKNQGLIEFRYTLTSAQTTFNTYSLFVQGTNIDCKRIDNIYNIYICDPTTALPGYDSAIAVMIPEYSCPNQAKETPVSKN